MSLLTSRSRTWTVYVLSYVFTCVCVSHVRVCASIDFMYGLARLREACVEGLGRRHVDTSPGIGQSRPLLSWSGRSG